MSIDYAALTQAAVAGFQDVRCCAVFSRDGLILGCHPSAEEERAMAAWRRLAPVGDVERGFLALRDEVWVVCRRGPYVAVAVGTPSARPGLVLDQLEQALLSAEEARARRDGVKGPAERDAPEATRGLRTSLHREPRQEETAPERAHEQVASAWASLLEGPVGMAASSGGGANAGAPPAPSASSASDLEADRVVHLADAEHQAGPGPAVPTEAGPQGEEQRVDGAHPARSEPEGLAPAATAPTPSADPPDEVVDRVEISRQFAGLLFEKPEETG
jgi:hypothetical protein